MSKDKNKYSLVVEPHGSYEKYVVYFEYIEGKGFQINKKPFKTCIEISKSPKGKHPLFEIDVFTSEMFNDSYELFRSLGLYQEIHNVYSQFTNSKGYVKRLPVLYDADLVIDKLSGIKNGKVVDEDQIEEYIEMLINDRTFFNNYMQHDSIIYKTRTVETLASEIRMYGLYVNQSGGSTESKECLRITREKLKNELSKYHIFRGFVLAEQKTLKDKALKEQSQKSLKSEEPKVYAKRIHPDYVPQDYKQIKLDGFGEQ